MSNIEKNIGYEFKNKQLLEEALTHPSITRQYEGTNKPFNYERFEFLGDSVLGLVVAEILIEKYPNEKEGSLAKRHAALVRGEALAKVAKKLDIGSYLRMTQGEEAMGGRHNASNNENAAEAIIGAIYSDGGFEKARIFVKTHWADMVDSMKEPPRDAKTALQEWSQGKGFPIPEYVMVRTTGPSHDPVFEVSVKAGDLAPVTATGASKKKAEKNAATKLLEIIESDNAS